MRTSGVGKLAMSSRKLQITLADTIVLIVGSACGFWFVRLTQVLYESTLPTLTHLLLMLDYFIWGLSFIGPVVVVLHRFSDPRAPKSASEVCLFWLGTVNFGVVAPALIFGYAGLWCVLIPFLMLRYYFGWIVLLILSAFVLAKTARSRDWSWPKLFGLLVTVGQTLGVIGFRLAAIDTVIDI